MDFIERLRDYINSLSVPYHCKLGVLEEAGSLVLYPLPGGKTIKQYYDGIKDQQYNFEFAIKSPKNYENYTMLNLIAAELEMLESLPSSDNSYDFQSIKVASAASPVAIDGGLFIYTLSIQAYLTIGGI